MEANGSAEQEPISAAFIHRLPSKMSSIAWCPHDEVCTRMTPPKLHFPVHLQEKL